MYSMGRVLLTDLAQETDYQSFSKREEYFWLQQFADVLNRCKACGYLLPDVDPDRFANDLLVLLYENSLRGNCVILHNGCFVKRCCVVYSGRMLFL